MGQTNLKPVRVLVIREERDGSYGRYYGHINGFVSHVSAKESCGFDGQRYGNDSEILELQLRSQCSDGSTDFYGFDICVEAYRAVTSNEARKAIRILAPIERKLAKMYETEGNPISVAQWINRIARAVGAVKVIIHDEERKRQTGDGWRAYTLGDSVYAIDRMAASILEWATELKKAA